MMDVKSYHSPSTSLDVRFIGESLSAGARPAVFYFALSATDSLSLDPFNHPVQTLSAAPIRIFSITLPGHEPPLPKEKAIEYWTEHAKNGQDILTPFFEQSAHLIRELIDAGAIDTLGFAGLSRGAFAAFHIAARLREVTAVCAFAPLTDFPYLPLDPTLDALAKKNVRIYIGNRDRRVGTKACCAWYHKLCDQATSHGIRSAPLELRIGPSIGYMGHGTSQAIFSEGAQWLLTSI